MSSYSFREYVAHEAASNVKHEYLAGQIYAMAGGSPEHSALIASIAGQLAPQLRTGRCRVHMSDLRVQVRETELTTHPDDPNTITNPKLIVEVSSPSTQAYDRGEKLDHYKRIASLELCLLVETDRTEIELWQRQTDGSWASRTITSGTITLEAIGAVLDVAAMYADAREPSA